MWYINFTKHDVTDSVIRPTFWKAWAVMFKLYMGGADVVTLEYVPTRF